jgi:uncharacterized protein with PQ loop repeat
MHVANIYVDPQVTGKMLGWAGAVFFAFCAVPQAIKTLKDGHARNLSSLFLWMWFWGAAFCAGGAFLDVGVVPWLMFNYSLSLLCVSLLLRYNLFPRRQAVHEDADGGSDH